MSAVFPAARPTVRVGTTTGREGDSFAYGRPSGAADPGGPLPLDPLASSAADEPSRWIAALKLIGLMTTLVAAAGVAVSILVRMALSGFVPSS
jgi:hypothetical protein